MNHARFLHPAVCPTAVPVRPCPPFPWEKAPGGRPGADRIGFHPRNKQGRPPFQNGFFHRVHGIFIDEDSPDEGDILMMIQAEPFPKEMKQAFPQIHFTEKPFLKQREEPLQSLLFDGEEKKGDPYGCDRQLGRSRIGRNLLPVTGDRKKGFFLTSHPVHGVRPGFREILAGTSRCFVFTSYAPCPGFQD